MIIPVKNLETVFKLLKCYRERERETRKKKEREVFHALIRVAFEETLCR